MHIVIDLILVAIIGFCAWRGYKNGIVVGICGLVAIIVSIVGANVVAKSYSEAYVGALEPFVTGIVDTAVNNVIEDPEEEELVYRIQPTERRDVYAVSFATLRNLGLSGSASKPIAEAITEDSDSVNQLMNNNITRRLCRALAFIVTFIIAFCILAIVFAVIGSIISLRFRIPGIDRLDWIIGIALGVIKGFMIVLVIAGALRYLGMFLPKETVEKTFLLELFTEHNLIANLLKI
jgi:uncharacterized membrane protein required for colicin V production